MSRVDNYLAAHEYAEGTDPITAAEGQAVILLNIRRVAAQRIALGRAPLPAWVDVSHQAVARKLIGWMLDAGWSPPSNDDIADAKQWVEDYDARWMAWWMSLSDEQQARFAEVYGTTGEYPEGLMPPQKRRS